MNAMVTKTSTANAAPSAEHRSHCQWVSQSRHVPLCVNKALTVYFWYATNAGREKASTVAAALRQSLECKSRPGQATSIEEGRTDPEAEFGNDERPDNEYRPDVASTNCMVLQGCVRGEDKEGYVDHARKNIRRA